MNRQAEKNSGFDPVRTFLSFGAGGITRWIAAGILTAVFYLVAAFVMGWMQTEPAVAIAAAVCFLMTLLLVWRGLQEEPMLILLCSALMVALGILAHLSMLDIRSGRIAKTLTPLLGDMWNYDLNTAMAWEDNAWSGGYLIILGLLSRLETFPVLYSIKLVDLVFVCLGAAAVQRLFLLNSGKPVNSLIVCGCALIAPTVLLNTGCWGHCDAIFSAICLWGLYLLLTGHSSFGCLLWGIAAGFKLQTAFLFPLLIPLFMDRKVAIRHLLVGLCGFFLLHIPMVVDGQPLLDIIARYNTQIDLVAYEGAGMTDMAPGVYGLMNVASVREFSGMGLFFSLTFALLFAMTMVRRLPLGPRDYLRCSVMLALGLPMILPQMNARSLYLALLLALACAQDGRSMAIAAGIEVISLMSYMASIFGNQILPLPVLSLMALAVCCVMLLSCLGIGRERMEPDYGKR